MIIRVVRPTTFARTSSLVLALVVAVGGVPQTAFSQGKSSLNGARESGAFSQKAPDGGVPDAPDGGDNGGGIPDDNGTDTPIPDGNGGADKQPNDGRGRPNTAWGREAARKAFAEERMRQMMARNGVSSPATQDAILEFLRNDEEGKRNMREAGRSLWNGMRRDVPAERLRTLLSDYQKALQTQREARLHAQTALDARVGYSLDPHLESLLWLLGVLGDGQNILNAQSPTPRRGWTPPINGIVTIPIQNKERQIEGIVNAKNRDGEALVWLEIRDAQGQLWRASPSSEPTALAILSHQIQALIVGDRVTVRIGAPGDGKGNTLLPLLAIIPVAKAGTNTGGANPPDN